MNVLIVVLQFVENDQEDFHSLFMELTIDEIISRLGKHNIPAVPTGITNPCFLDYQISQSKLKRAAVLIPFIPRNGKWHLLYIRRTQKEDDLHSGQVAFPGGHCDPSDPDAVHTAYRELFEETGIAPNDVKYLGRLRDVVTTTGYRITPIVGAIPWPYPLVPQPEEVSRIFTIPIEWLLDPANQKAQHREHTQLSQTLPVIFFEPYDGEILWGASARITHLLLEALGLLEIENGKTA